MFYSMFLCNSSSKGIVLDVRGGERDKLSSTLILIIINSTNNRGMLCSSPASLKEGGGG